MTEILTYLLMFVWCEQLIKVINFFPFPPRSRIDVSEHQVLERFGELRVTDHQLGVQEALNESDTAFFFKVGGKLVPYHIA